MAAEFTVDISEAWGTYKTSEWKTPLNWFLGQDLSEAVPVVLKNPAFNKHWQPEAGFTNLHGKPVGAILKAYKPVLPETQAKIRRTGDDDSYWVNLNIGGQIHDDWSNLTYQQIVDQALSNGYVLGFCSRVSLQNLTIPSSYSTGIIAHYPMLDVDNTPPTETNIKKVSWAIINRCGIDTFFLVRSSKNGMSMFSPELVNTNHLESIWTHALKIDGIHKDWVSRSKETMKFDSGVMVVPETHSCGILRITKQPSVKEGGVILKPEQPRIIATVQKGRMIIDKELTI